MVSLSQDGQFGMIDTPAKMQGEKPKPIRSAMDKIDYQLDQVSLALAHLEDQLQWVLRPSDPEVAKSSGEVSVTIASNATYNLENIATAIKSFHTRIMEINQRLEL